MSTEINNIENLKTLLVTVLLQNMQTIYHISIAW